MLLVIDVGNTHTVIGVFEGTTLAGHWRLETKKERTADEWGIFIKEILAFGRHDTSLITAVAVASVVPTLALAINEMCVRYFGSKPFIAEVGVASPLAIRLENPEELGADRLVNAVAAHALYKSDCIIIDFGTATTFDVVTASAEYLGGVICPGIGISAEALFHRASKLPRVEISKPSRVVGRRTVECMQSGLYYGYIGLTDALVERIRAETGMKKARTIATGGLAGIIAKDSKTIEVVDELLTLNGLRILYELNNKIHE